MTPLALEQADEGSGAEAASGQQEADKNGDANVEVLPSDSKRNVPGETTAQVQVESAVDVQAQPQVNAQVDVPVSCRWAPGVARGA